MLRALGFVPHDNTFYVAIVKKAEYEASGEHKLEMNRAGGSGWYLEYCINPLKNAEGKWHIETKSEYYDRYLIIKNTYQMTDVLNKETRDIEANLKNPDYVIGYAIQKHAKPEPENFVVLEEKKDRRR